MFSDFQGRSVTRSPYWFYGNDDGSWDLVGRPVLAFKRAGFDWEMAPAMSADNQRRNFRVEGATESNKGFRVALTAIVDQHPELIDWAVRFDGPWLPLADVLAQPAFSWTDTFYHGTSEAALPFIRQHGICPRDVTGSRPAYGGEDKAGRPDTVYLTTQLGMARFAARDAGNVTRSPGVVLAVHGVDPLSTVPDEDSGEATARASVDHMGSFGVRGCIPPETVSIAYVWRDGEWQAVDAALGGESDIAGWRDITPKMRQRVRKVLKDWQQHARPFEDTAYWAKRFLPFADVFAHTLGTRPIELFRAERTDIDNRYADRFTSWSRRPDNVEGFGWGQRRMVTAVFQPEDILVDFVNLDLDTEGFQEVIVRPGHYNIIPWRLGWDRTGAFNVYAQPERARAQGYTLGDVADDDGDVEPTIRYTIRRVPPLGGMDTIAAFIRRRRVGQLQWAQRRDSCPIGEIWVDPEYQRMGIGSALIAEAHRRCLRRWGLPLSSSGIVSPQLQRIFRKMEADGLAVWDGREWVIAVR